MEQAGLSIEEEKKLWRTYHDPKSGSLSSLCLLFLTLYWGKIYLIHADKDYYYHTKTKETTWEKVLYTLYPSQ